MLELTWGALAPYIFFCLSMDPIFTFLNQIPGVVQVEGYVDDTKITASLTHPHTWVSAVMAAIHTWKDAGIIMDPHECWKLGIPTNVSLPANQILPLCQYSSQIHFLPNGFGSSLWDALHKVPSFSGSVVVARGDSRVHFTAARWRNVLSHGDCLIGKLAVKECQCRSKTTMLINTGQAPNELNAIGAASVGLQCLAPSTINLGLSITTGWKIDTDGTTCREPTFSPYIGHLQKQIQKIKARLNAARANHLSVRLRIVYFNTFCLSLFYYVQSVVVYKQEELRPLYQEMSSFILQRKWFPAGLLPGVSRWLGIGPLLDPFITQMVAAFGLFHRHGYYLNNNPCTTTFQKRIDALWRTVIERLSLEQIASLLSLYNLALPPPQLAKKFNDMLKPQLADNLIIEAKLHVQQRIWSSGWPQGPQLPFLEWVANCPHQSLGHVPRYSILRWCLTEDSDAWFSQRSQTTRGSCCCHCQQPARNYFFGPQYGGLCETCCPITVPWYQYMLTDEERTLVENKLSVTIMPKDANLEPLISKIGEVDRGMANSLTLPCLWCHTGSNTIDHWCRFCPVPHLVLLVLTGSTRHVWDLSHAPTEVQGLLCSLTLFHMRHVLLEQGGLAKTHDNLKLADDITKPVIEIVAVMFASSSSSSRSVSMS